VLVGRFGDLDRDDLVLGYAVLPPTSISPAPIDV